MGGAQWAPLENTAWSSRSPGEDASCGKSRLDAEADSQGRTQSYLCLGKCRPKPWTRREGVLGFRRLRPGRRGRAVRDRALCPALSGAGSGHSRLREDG